jgi:hypothetical protein
MVVHEAPKLLPASTEGTPDTLSLSILSPQLKSTLKVIGGAIGAVGLALVAITGLAILAVAVLAVAAAILVPATIVASVAILDPILIAVTEDGYWVEIDRWV